MFLLGLRNAGKWAGNLGRAFFQALGAGRLGRSKDAQFIFWLQIGAAHCHLFPTMTLDPDGSTRPK